MNLFKKIILFAFSLQEKMLKKSLNKTINFKSNSKRKFFSNKDCLLTLDSLAESQKKLLEEEIELILKSCNFSPVEILDYIKKHGTKVFYVKFSTIIKKIIPKEGFIYPQKGIKAFFIALFLMKKLKFKIDEAFVIYSKDIDKYYFIYHFYNWFCYKKGIEGVNLEAINLLDKYLNTQSNDFINNLQLSDIILLKDAIRQDKNAIDFVLKICKKYDSSKKALEKIKQDGAKI